MYLIWRQVLFQVNAKKFIYHVQQLEKFALYFF